MTRMALGLIVSIATLLAASPAAVAEVFILTNGGRVTGEWLNREETPREKFVIRTPGGGRITLDRSQVERTLSPRPVETEYQAIRPSYPDTVEGQWALAEWCRENRLNVEREKHLGRIVELDPDHADARGALGYKQIDGGWATQDEVMARNGYKSLPGSLADGQEIELIEKGAEGELRRRIGR